MVDQAIGGEVATKFCRDCGASISARAEICPKCGIRQMDVPAPIQSPTATASSRNRLAAALFALLLGGLGVHKFYLGKPIQGVIYLLFCWTFIPAIIGFIEGIVLLATTDEKFARTYPD